MVNSLFDSVIFPINNGGINIELNLMIRLNRLVIKIFPKST